MGKKEFRNQVEAKLEASLSEFVKGVSEKKFKKLVKKAGKLLSEGLFTAEEKIVEAVAVPEVKAKKAKAVKVEKVAKKAPVKKAKAAKPVVPAVKRSRKPKEVPAVQA